MSTAGTVLRIDAAMRGNKVIYWITRLPIIRRLKLDGLYGADEGKVVLSVLLWVWRVLRGFVGKFLYVGLALVLPAYLACGLTLSPDGFGPFCWLLVILSFVVGTLIQPKAVEPNQLKYTCVRMMRVDASRYQRLVCGWEHLAMFVTFTPALMVAVAVLGQGAAAGLLLSVKLACARLMGESLHLLVYHLTGKTVVGKALWLVSLSVFGFCGAYLPVFIVSEELGPTALAPQTVLFHPAAIAAFLVLGALCTVWQWRYPRYYQLTMDTSRPELVYAALAKQKAAGAQFSDVKLKDSDLTAEGECAGLTGWPYLQALFFRRHRRMLYKPVKIVLAIWAVITVAAWVVMLLFRDGELEELLSALPRILPFCVFFLYFIDNTIGTRITKAMFYNCDLAMLRYGWYREPQVVLANFALRFRRLCKVNLLISAAAGVSFIGMVLCGGGRPDPLEFVIFLAALLCLGVFFAVHCLGMYYLFQPYTSDLQVKNPFFAAINIIIYILCYGCIQIRSTPSWFALLVLVVTVVYSAAILLLVWKRAPRTFRVK